MVAFTYHTHPRAFSNLERRRYINLTTFRENGQAVDIPIWFVVHNGTIYVETDEQTGQVECVRHTSRVFLAPCTASGRVTVAAVEGKARIVTDVQEIYIARAALHRKYGFKRVAFSCITLLIGSLKGKPTRGSVYLAIEPVYIA